MGSFIGTSNQKDLLTDPSGSRRFICVEVTGVIDTTQPIDYEQLYAQAMHEIYHGERYWFDSEDEKIMTENNREFEQTPAILQLFQFDYLIKSHFVSMLGGYTAFLQKSSKVIYFAGRQGYATLFLQVVEYFHWCQIFSLAFLLGSFEVLVE